MELGPIIDKANQERLLGIIERADQEATKVVRGTTGGNDLSNGYFITPSIFEIDDVAHDLVQDELFGPIVSLERFSMRRTPSPRPMPRSGLRRRSIPKTSMSRCAWAAS